MTIADPGELQERERPGADGCAWQVGELPAKHRAGEDALEAPRMAIAVPGDLQESVGPGADGLVWQVDELPANHRASRCALERCLEGFAVLDGHKSMPSRERMCPVGP